MNISIYDETSGSHYNGSSLNDLFGLIITVSLVLLFGITMLYSTSSGTVGSTFFIKQMIWAGVGVTMIAMITLAGYKKISEYSIILLLFTVFLLIVADFWFPSIKGANRWIRIPKVGSIQPSEFAKLALILFLARYCSEKMRFMNDISLKRGLVPAVAVSGVVLMFIFLGKDWGATFLLGAVVMLVLFVAGVRLRYLLLPVLLSPLFYLYLRTHDKERLSRMVSFLNPEMCQSSDGYQLWHSILALGSGNWFGLGFTQSRMKAKYLPEAHTDFILSIVGEELGFVFICLVIVAYLCFMYFAVRISMNSRNRQGMLLGFGVTAIISFQAAINLGVVSGALPTKGMPAPFISYGGSNLIMCLAGVGLLTSIALDNANIDLMSYLPGINFIKKKFLSKQ